MSEKQKFVINNYLDLRLGDDNKTKIFLNGEEFLICKGVVVNISKEKLQKVETMDDVFETSKMVQKEGGLMEYGIDPLTEFWVHCSNLQVWAENNYNADLIHSNLAFPLLKSLAEAGDKLAKRKLGEEISRRYTHGSLETKSYLEFEGFLDMITQEELILGGMSFEEGNLLVDIINYMKGVLIDDGYGNSFGISYEIVKHFDEDKVRHRLGPSNRFLTIYDGHVKTFEFDLSEKSLQFFKMLSEFKGLRYLSLIIRDLKNDVVFNKKMKNNLKILKISKVDLSCLNLQMLELFPELESLTIHFFEDELVTGIESITKLEKLQSIFITNCRNFETFNMLKDLKNKGILIKFGL